MTLRAAALVLVLGVGCDVEVSLGGHDANAIDAAHDPDAGSDAGHDGGMDAGNDAGSDAGNDGGSDVGIDAWTHELDANDGGGSMCTAAADASACAMCEAAMCCELLTTCAGATNCACIVDCVFTGHAVDGCVTHCGADHGEHTPLIDCGHGHCAGVCL